MRRMWSGTRRRLLLHRKLMGRHKMDKPRARPKRLREGCREGVGG